MIINNILLSETLHIIKITTIYDSRIFQYTLLEKIGDLSPHRQRFQPSILEKGTGILGQCIDHSESVHGIDRSF